MEISRKTEFVLGLIGGILGILTAIMVMTVGGAASLFEAEGAGSVTTTGFIALLFSILGLVGACMVKNHNLLGGTFMVAAAIGGTISTAFFYIVPLILFVIAGLMALIRGGEFVKVFKQWWFYVLIVAAIAIPIIGYVASGTGEASTDTDNAAASSSDNTTSSESEASSSDSAEKPAASEEETTEEENTMGDRTDPVPVNQALSLKCTLNDLDSGNEFDANLDVTVTGTIRGDEAWNMIYQENQFNEEPPAGKEYVLVKVKIKMYDATSEQDKYNVSSYDFDFISSAGSSLDMPTVVVPNELDGEIYNNGELEGYVCGLVDEGDAALLRFDSQFFFSI